MPDQYAAGSVRRMVDEFASAPGRSVAVETDAPVRAGWSANADMEHTAGSLLKIPVVGAFLSEESQTPDRFARRVRPDMMRPTGYPSVRAAFSDSSLTMREIAALSIVCSDNAAASFILETAGAGAYRRFLADAGCAHTGTPPGFQDHQFAELAGCATTAADQMRILRHVWRTECCRPLRGWMANNLLNARLSARTEPPDLFAHKTGTLSGAVHDVGVLTTASGMEAFIVVLTSGNADSIDASHEIAGFGRDLARALGRLAATGM